MPATLTAPARRPKSRRAYTGPATAAQRSDTASDTTTTAPGSATGADRAGPIPAWNLSQPAANRTLGFGPDMPAPAAWTDKHRPATLADIVGQGPAVFRLQSFVETPYSTAFLFDGPSGVGKTSMALALAADLGCDPMWAIHKIKSGDQDAEAVERGLAALRFVAPGSGWKMLIVDEADWMSPKAAQLWLSALESLPPRSIIVFTTNHLDKIKRTAGVRFLDRCIRIPFSGDGRTLRQDAQALIDRIWAAEGGAMSDAPRVDDLPGVVDADGIISFRRAVRELEQLKRDGVRAAGDTRTARAARTTRPPGDLPLSGPDGGDDDPDDDDDDDYTADDTGDTDDDSLIPVGAVPPMDRDGRLIEPPAIDRIAAADPADAAGLRRELYALESRMNWLISMFGTEFNRLEERTRETRRALKRAERRRK